MEKVIVRNEYDDIQRFENGNKIYTIQLNHISINLYISINPSTYLSIHSLTSEKSTHLATCLVLYLPSSLPSPTDHRRAEKSPDAVATIDLDRGSILMDQTAPWWPWRVPIQSPVSPR